MEAALAGGGVSWGFGEDAEEDLPDGPPVDWRTYSDRHGLSDKQARAPPPPPPPSPHPPPACTAAERVWPQQHHQQDRAKDQD